MTWMSPSPHDNAAERPTHARRAQRRIEPSDVLPVPTPSGVDDILSCVVRALRRLLTVATLATVAACGAKTALEVPPLPPCELDASVPRDLLMCERYALGPPIALTVEPGPPVFDNHIVSIESIDATSHTGGAWVVFQARDEPAATVEIRTIDLDAGGAARGAARTIVARPIRSSESVVEPSVVEWGCGRAALGGLATQGRDGVAHTGCTLALETTTSFRTVDGGPDENCWDLQRDGDGLSWFRLEPGSRPRIVLARADLAGGARSTEETILPSRFDRIPLRDGSFLTAEGGSFDRPLGGRVSRRSGDGALVAETRLTERVLESVTSVEDEAGTTWLVYAEADERNALPQDLLARPVEDDGTIGAPVTLETEASLVAYDDTRPVWLGRRLVIPLRDQRFGASIGVFTADGAALAELPLAPNARDVDLVLVEGGALVVYSDVRFAVDDRGLTLLIGSVLVARPLTCMP